MRLRDWLRAQYAYHVEHLRPCEDCGILIPRREPDQQMYYPRCWPCMERYEARCAAACGLPPMLPGAVTRIDPAAMPRFR